MGTCMSMHETDFQIDGHPSGAATHRSWQSCQLIMPLIYLIAAQKMSGRNLQRGIWYDRRIISHRLSGFDRSWKKYSVQGANHVQAGKRYLRHQVTVTIRVSIRPHFSTVLSKTIYNSVAVCAKRYEAGCACGGCLFQDCMLDRYATDYATMYACLKRIAHVSFLQGLD